MSTTNGMTFNDFIAALPAERQQPAAEAWQLVRQAMPAGYTEHVGPKYLEFRVGKDMYIGLANQKGHLSLHVVPMYLMPALQEQLAAAAPKLKMGKGCVNFKKSEELPTEALSGLIAATLPADYAAKLQEVRGASRKKG
ncbi:DUF1801 domain-containing protein [Hymenobacter sp. DH14]|uniref:DUF1801 domain-containing protein n=1 Tax=Hymenobacter cyanobacteriorum TaxID=2926463 RepID=A0A9X2AFR5_9BACT|nr:DUF1801 domain-containing protein [Hymenobacter cyanobacteriorum]MCI1186818.1 DUF1801 domain-containing protein [Hymenobacter cyanobacteriorum]